MSELKNVKARHSKRYGWTLTKTEDDYCANCGHPAHDGPLWKDHFDGDMKPVSIKVCDHYRKQEKLNELV